MLNMFVRLIGFKHDLLGMAGNAFTGAGKFVGDIGGDSGALSGRLDVVSDDVLFIGCGIGNTGHHLRVLRNLLDQVLQIRDKMVEVRGGLAKFILTLDR